MIHTEELTCVEFLQHIGTTYANRIAFLAQPREVPRGTLLFREGEQSTWIYLLLTGSVALEITGPSGKPKKVQTIRQGELVGWSPVLGLPTMTATARTLERCRLAALDVRELQEMCQKDPHFGSDFMKNIAITLAKRLQATRQKLV